MENKKIFKIIIPIVMIIGIAAIWFMQNQGTQENSNNLEFPLTVTSIDLDELASYELPIIIDFGSDECIPCQEMAPALEIVNEKMQGLAIIQFIDVWEYPEAIGDFPVQVIPTQIFINSDGSPYSPSDEVASVIEFYIYGDSETGEHFFTVHQGGLTEDEMLMILADMGAEL
ncbi:MAG: thioredoxin family protein [Clostridia bacterium]